MIGSLKLWTCVLRNAARFIQEVPEVTDAALLNGVGVASQRVVDGCQGVVLDQSL